MGVGGVRGLPLLPLLIYGYWLDLLARFDDAGLEEVFEARGGVVHH